uniref:Uncharacterized protein n=1 Tax=Poecilia mexicana TaxID=48701 RepID=A0A3B3WF81_9TELE
MKQTHARAHTHPHKSVLFLVCGSDGAEEDQPVEDLLKPGHLTQLLEAELEAEVEALSVGSVSVAVTKLLGCVRRHRDSCSTGVLIPVLPVFQEVNQACRALVRFLPLLGVYSDLVRYFLSVLLTVHRSTGKLLSVLSSIFIQLAQKVQWAQCVTEHSASRKGAQWEN